MSASTFKGFYFNFKDHMATIEPELCQLFDQIYMRRDYYDHVDLTIDGHYTLLQRKYMTTHRRLYLDSGFGNEDINIFKGVYLKTLEDGIMFRHIMMELLESNDLPRKLVEAKIRYYIAQQTYKTARHSGLRSVYWYMHDACISRWPEPFDALWTADCLLFGELRCCSANIVGMHALVLGVMMGVRQFHKYFPVELRRHETFTKPHFANYFNYIGLPTPAVLPYKPKELPYKAGDPLD